MEDYDDVRKLSERWQVAPKRMPFQKFVVSCLGTTSAGKSAFINHFYRAQCKRSAVGQLDTHYTVVETVPPEEFAKFSFRGPQKFSPEQLAAPLLDPHADPRYGIVFVHLDTPLTLARYAAQFDQHAREFASYGLVTAVLVNEQYLPREDPEWFAFASKTIFIDSPGFDAALGAERDLIEKFLGNLKILQFIYSMSDQTLFFIPATQLNLVSSQLAMLELSILYSIQGAHYMKQLLKESNASHSWLPSPTDLKDLLVRKVKGQEAAFSYKGNSAWDKIKFIMSKIDEVLQPGGRLEEQYFEFGRLLGRQLAHMEPPTFSQCAAIGLPGHGKDKKGSSSARLTGDLATLLTGLRTLNESSTFETRLTEALLEWATGIHVAVQGSWSAQWYSTDLALVKAILRRLQKRLAH